jgi:hypothetical protein
VGFFYVSEKIKGQIKMPNLQQNQSVKDTLRAGKVLTVTVTTGSVGVSIPNASINKTITASESFGYFDKDVTIELSAFSGSVASFEIGDPVPASNQVAILTPAQSARTDITGVAASTESGNTALPDGRVSRFKSMYENRTCAFIPYMPSNYDNTTSTLTHHDLRTVPCHFDAIQVIEFNVGAADVLVDSYAFAVTENISSLTTPVINGVSYNNVAANGTFNGWIVPSWGTPSATIPAGTFANPGVWVSPILPLPSIPRADGGTFPALMMRKYLNARTQSNVVFTNSTEHAAAGEALAPYTYIARAQLGVDGVSNPAAFNTPVATGTGRFFGLILWSRGTAQTIMYCGDSITRGLGAGGEPVANPNTGLQFTGGWTTQAAVALADINNPVGFANLGQPGQTSATYLAFAKKMFPILNPTIATFATYSPNDVPINDSVIAAELSRTLDFIKTSFSYNAQPVLYAATPYGSASNTLRMNYVSKIAAMSYTPVINPNIAGVYDPNGANNFATGANVDAAHPSLLGYTRIAQGAATPVLSDLMGR